MRAPLEYSWYADWSVVQRLWVRQLGEWWSGNYRCRAARKRPVERALHVLIFRPEGNPLRLDRARLGSKSIYAYASQFVWRRRSLELNA